MKTNDKYYVQRTTPKNPDKVNVVKINNSRFTGTKETFINLNNNYVHLYKTQDGSIFDIKEMANKYDDFRPKLMGCYEIPEDSKWRGDGNFLLVEKQVYHSSPNGGFGYIYEDEWKVRIMAASPSTDGSIGGVDECIIGMSGAELRDIVKFSDEKHGDTLVLSMKKKDHSYKVKINRNNAVLENSDDIVYGRIHYGRVVPSARDLDFQSSGDARTQTNTGVWVNITS
jgi:hypothetical protein